MNDNEIIGRLLAEMRDDYVGLWSVIRSVDNKLQSGADIRAETLKILRNLLDGGLIQAGFPGEAGGFEPWDISSTEAINKIDSAWSNLGREPDIGDVVWFTTTAEGEKQIASEAET